MPLRTESVFHTFAMKTRLLSLSICPLILIFLPSVLSRSLAAESLRRRALFINCPPNLLQPFWREPCVPKHRGVSLTKKVQLYSRTSGHFVQIREKEVDACGIKGSSYARVVLESVNFDRITIRGEKANRYLCLNEKGELGVRSNFQMRKQGFAATEQCEFSEEDSEGFYQYRSVKYPQWFVGFSRNGEPRKGRKSAKQPKHKYGRQFMRYYI